MTEQAQCYAVSLAKSLIIVVSLLDALVCFSVIQSEYGQADPGPVT